MANYDVAIIGAGPAGLFAAQSILNNSDKMTVVLVDKGKTAAERSCCRDCRVCRDKDCCSMLCGVGGCGLYSDGKLVLDLHCGGKLDSIASLTENTRDSMVQHVVDTLKKYDGVSDHSASLTSDEMRRWESLFKSEGLELKHYDVLHMGTYNLTRITSRFAAAICENSRVTLKTNCEIIHLEEVPDETMLYAINGERFSAKYVIFAVGKTGSNWLDEIFQKYKIPMIEGDTYLGVRLEVPQAALENLFRYSYDPKIWTYYGKRKVKTHCFCRRGEIVCTNYMGYPVAGGHTRYTPKNEIEAEKQSSRGNFNILVSTDRSKLDIREILNQFLKLNSDGLAMQNLLDFLSLPKKTLREKGTFSERYMDGNIRGVLDQLDNTGELITDFILRLSKILPGILDETSVVYAPALEWFMDSVKVNSHMETSHSRWFAVGDGAGLSQGIVHSAATGIIAAEEICRQIR